jgi:hypothetical protein
LPRAGGRDKYGDSAFVSEQAIRIPGLALLGRIV